MNKLNLSCSKTNKLQTSCQSRIQCFIHSINIQVKAQKITLAEPI